MSIDFAQATTQTQGASQDFYSGVIQCNIYVPRGKGSSTLSSEYNSLSLGTSSCFKYLHPWKGLFCSESVKIS